MTVELEMAGYAMLLAFLQLFLYVIPGSAQTGLGYALSARDENRPLSGFAGRARRAFYNHLETLPIFLGAIFLCHLAAVNNAMTEFGAQLYVIARVAYIPAYLSGAPVVRTVIWAAAMAGVLLVLSQPFL